MQRYNSKKTNSMKKLFFIFSLIGLFSLTSCGAQEECRGRADNNIQQHTNNNMLAVNYLQEK